MVSGTRCPAWSDQLKKWSESRAAAPKGRCPVGHRGEFPGVLRENTQGLRRLLFSLPVFPSSILILLTYSTKTAPAFPTCASLLHNSLRGICAFAQQVEKDLLELSRRRMTKILYPIFHGVEQRRQIVRINPARNAMVFSKKLLF